MSIVKFPVYSSSATAAVLALARAGVKTVTQICVDIIILTPPESPDMTLQIMTTPSLHTTASITPGSSSTLHHCLICRGEL